MLDKHQAYKIGGFVFAGIALFIISLFIFGGKQAFFRSNITLHAHFDQVQGLNVGSVVSLAGIKVGNVEDIRFLETDNKLDIVMRVDQELAARITKDSFIEMRTQGALGDKYLMIVPGAPQSGLVKNEDVINVRQEADLLGVISNRGNEVNKIFDILEEFNKLSKSFNKENRTDEILKNLKEASALLKENLAEARKMMSQQNSQKVVEILQRMDSIVSKVDRGEGTLGALINDPALHDQLKTILGSNQKKNSVKSLIRTSIQSSEKD